MTDFCYFCNAALCLLVFCYPDSKVFYYGCYVTCTGSLAGGILTFRNSMVYHHFDKLSDLTIHLLPLVTMWNIHWNLRGTAERKQWGFMPVDDIEFGWQFVYEYFSIFYLFFFIWFPLYLLIHYVCWTHIINNGYWCMILFQFERGPLISPIRAKHGDRVALVGFIVQNIIYVTLCSIVTLPGFLSRWYSLVQVLLHTFVTIKNGGDYYMLYFSENYESSLKQLDEIGSGTNFEYKRNNKTSSE